jgi:hypothetical protein
MTLWVRMVLRLYPLWKAAGPRAEKTANVNAKAA